jgi:4-coumarate--CoA ligase
VTTLHTRLARVTFPQPEHLHHAPFPLLTLKDTTHSLAKPDTAIHISAADPTQSLTVSRARVLTEATSSALRKHFKIGANGAGKDVVSVISTGHYLLPVLSYGIIGVGGVFSAASAASTASELSKQIRGAESKLLCCVEGTREVAVKAAEEAGWGRNGGGRVVIMGEEEWSLKVVQTDGRSGPNLINESQRLPWEKITDPTTLDNSLVVLIYSSGTTGLPKGAFFITRLPVSQLT